MSGGVDIDCSGVQWMVKWRHIVSLGLVYG